MGADRTDLDLADLDRAHLADLDRADLDRAYRARAHLITALTMDSRSNAAVHDLYATNDGDVWAATGDGACTKWTDIATAPVVDTELFGPTYDAVHGVTGYGNKLYTVSRDRVLRTYTLE
ncbi:hypothetical protein SDRG_15711 [Saprolegnia diclina VS20]|uniref:Uncharacterized protein n=1 Tax=Saprolegnia diclina (strain VS20) TaxID=1156394 RepID=T0PM83_SAPDV|nr:hypothetical protein SDRG_15711 [Saprolegnia diclina VS20]EQC26469.1 hypothetical protein SDRG_15711 [Saprolegnia diclina VS20]|eukprot:XP_008620115.1 hypothetical protein SDRG_15711 [Saprolegnia diclina VS20]